MALNNEQLIEIKVKPKEYQLIQFWRKLKFGKIENIVIHGGVPQKIGRSYQEIMFDGNVKLKNANGY